MVKLDISLPHFHSFVDHLKMFGRQHAIKNIWEIIEFTQEHKESTLYLEELINQWKILTIDVSVDRYFKAEAEINQILQFANPILLESLVVSIEEAYKDVEAILSREEITAVIKKYNDAPEKKLKKIDSIEENWIVTNEKLILNPDYIDIYMESIINLHIFPDFEMLCARVLKLCGISHKIKLLFKPGSETFESKLLNDKRLDKVIKLLIAKKYLVEDKGEYYWQGIGSSMVGSLAALAKYLEESGIMGGFSIMTEGFRAYKMKFNIKESDQKEWNKKYHSKTGIRFDVVGDIEFEDQLDFILDV